MALVHVTTDNFETEVLKAGQPVLVDFWASWCGPCRMLTPIIEQLAGELTDVKVGKINVDEEPDLAARYGVMSIPTVIVFKNGEEAARSVGFKPKNELLKLLGK